MAGLGVMSVTVDNVPLQLFLELLAVLFGDARVDAGLEKAGIDDLSISALATR